MPKAIITHIAIRNLCGARNVEIDLRAHMAIIAGGNAEGKTSLRDAISLAFTKIPSRVGTKKADLKSLITESCKSATIGVGVTLDGEPMMATYALPTGEGISPRFEEPQASCLPLVLNPTAFARISDDGRRQIIQRLFGIGAGPEIPARLAKEDLPKDKIEELEPLLVSGFDAAVLYATNKASEARAAWKAITNEAYGSLKAKAWVAPKPEVDIEALAAATTERASLEAQASEIRGALAVIVDRNQNANKAQARRNELTALVNDIEHRKSLVDLAQKELDDFTPKFEDIRRRAEARRPTYPEITHRLAVDLRDALTVTGSSSSALDEYDDSMQVSVDPEAQTRLPDYEKSKGVLERMFRTRTEALLMATNAKVLLSEMPEAGQPEDTTAKQEALAELNARIADLTRSIDAQNAKHTLFEVADENTAKAAAHHADVTAWTHAAELLGPNGIPAEFMAKALEQINRRMAKHSVGMQEYDEKWPTVTVSPDMGVRGNARPYGLLSKSEQWRCDFMLTESIAHFSGLGFMLADEMDMLTLSGRDAVIGWMDAQANTGIQVIALGTFKGPLNNLPSTIATFWIADGVLTTELEAQAA